MKQMKPFAGKWRILVMEVWDQDYVDMEVPGSIRTGLNVSEAKAATGDGASAMTWTI